MQREPETSGRPRPGPAFAFVGREASLSGLRREWQRVADGESRIAWVVGEAGIGKTTLVRRLVEETDASQVVWVSADESEYSLPFALVAQAQDLLRRRAGHGSTGADRRSTPAAGVKPFEVGAALLAKLGTIDRPLVMVFDDLQWADPPSAAALLFALRRLEGDAVLVVLVTRADAGDVLGPSWDRLLRDEHRVMRVALDGFSAAEVAALAETRGWGRLDVASAERLREHTDGHPLHTAVLLSALSREDLSRSTRPLPVPRSLAELTLARVGALSAPAQDLVEAGAVLGTTFSPTNAATMGSVADADAALQAAIAAGVLDRVGPGRARFPHPLLRAAVYHDLAPPSLRRLHAAAATVTSGLTALRHRIDAAETATERWAGELEAAADGEMAADHFSTAAELLQSAAQVTPGPVERDRRMLSAAEALIRGSHYDRALTMRTQIEACAPGPFREYVLALTDLVSGSFHSAIDGFRVAVEKASLAGRDDLRSRALSGLAFAQWVDGEYERAFEAADLALRGRPGWVAAITSYVRALCLMHLGRGDEFSTLEEPVGLSDLDRLATRGLVRLCAGDLVDAIADLSTVVRRCRQGGSSPLFLFSLVNLAEAEFLNGRWDDATVHAELAVSLATDTEDLMELSRAHAMAAEVHAGRGHFDVAAAHVTAAEGLLKLLPSRGEQAAVAMAKAALAQARGDENELRQAVVPFLDGSSPFPGRPGWWWRVLVVEASLGADEAAAGAALAALTTAVETHGHDTARADLARLWGLWAEATGEPEAAQRHYATIGEPPEGTPPLSVARLRLAHGALLRRRGDRRRATAQLRSAQEIFTVLAAAPYLQACATEMKACGLRATADGGRVSLALTPREEAVALLVAEGLTNREAALQLYVSTKAVEYHLGHIYAKLGISSRRELAARIRAYAPQPEGTTS